MDARKRLDAERRVALAPRRWRSRRSTLPATRCRAQSARSAPRVERLGGEPSHPGRCTQPAFGVETDALGNLARDRSNREEERRKLRAREATQPCIPDLAQDAIDGLHDARRRRHAIITERSRIHRGSDLGIPARLDQPDGTNGAHDGAPLWVGDRGQHAMQRVESREP
jgi:hypothetical protein